MNNHYEIISWNFDRDDGFVSLRIQGRKRNQSPLPRRRSPPVVRGLVMEPHQLVIQKVRAKKVLIAALKQMLRNKYNVNNYREFYRLYGFKMIEMDFGMIELYNIKGENAFSISELQQLNRNTHFIRWGKIFNAEYLSNPAPFIGTLTGLQYFRYQIRFYNSIVRERLFTLRTLKYYKDDLQRKQFPYSQLYLLDIEDTLDFSLKNLQLSQNGHLTSSNSMGSKQIDGEFLKLQESQSIINNQNKFFEQYFGGPIIFTNIIIPLLQFPEQNDEFLQTFFFIHLKRVDEKSQRYTCKMIVDKEFLCCPEDQFKIAIANFITSLNFSLSLCDIEVKNEKIAQSGFLDCYVEYIEKTFFQNSQPFELIQRLIFEDVPSQLLKKTYNSILDERLAIPNNIEQIINQLQK